MSFLVRTVRLVRTVWKSFESFNLCSRYARHVCLGSSRFRFHCRPDRGKRHIFVPRFASTECSQHHLHRPSDGAEPRVAEQQFPDALMQWIVTLVDLAQNPGDEHAVASAADDGDNDCDDGFLAHWESFRKGKTPHVATVGSCDNHVWDFELKMLLGTFVNEVCGPPAGSSTSARGWATSRPTAATSSRNGLTSTWSRSPRTTSRSARLVQSGRRRTQGVGRAAGDTPTRLIARESPTMT